MSLQSRLDIICDEADGDMHESESSHDILSEKLIPQAELELLRCDGIYYHVREFLVCSFSNFCSVAIQDALITRG